MGGGGEFTVKELSVNSDLFWTVKQEDFLKKFDFSLNFISIKVGIVCIIGQHLSVDATNFADRRIWFATVSYDAAVLLFSNVQAHIFQYYF